MTTEGYRRLTVKSVKPASEPGFVFVDFEESAMSLAFSPDIELSVGDKIDVKGKNGNTDADLWGIDTLADMRKVVSFDVMTMDLAVTEDGAWKSEGGR